LLSWAVWIFTGPTGMAWLVATGTIRAIPAETTVAMNNVLMLIKIKALLLNKTSSHSEIGARCGQSKALVEQEIFRNTNNPCSDIMGPVWHGSHPGPHQSLLASIDAEIQPYTRPVIRPVVAIVRLVIIIIVIRLVIIVPISGDAMMPVAAPVIVITAIARPSLPTLLIIMGIDDIAILYGIDFDR
jgi:hypothetical protein